MPSILMYGTDWCSDCQRAKAFLEAQFAAATGEGVLASFGVKEYLKRAW